MSALLKKVATGTARSVFSTTVFRLLLKGCLVLQVVIVVMYFDRAALGRYAYLRAAILAIPIICGAGLPMSATYFISLNLKTRDYMSYTSNALLLSLFALPLSYLAWMLAFPLVKEVFTGYSNLMIHLMGVCCALTAVKRFFTGLYRGREQISRANIFLLMGEVVTTLAMVIMIKAGYSEQPALVVSVLVGLCVNLFWGSDLIVFMARGFAWTTVHTKEMVSYGLKSLSTEVVLFMETRVDTLIIGLVASPYVLGVYTLAQRATEVLQVLTGAINFVLMPKLTASNPEKRDSSGEKVVLLSLGIASAGALALGLTAFVGQGLIIQFFPKAADSFISFYIILLGAALNVAVGAFAAYNNAIARPELTTYGIILAVLVLVGWDVVFVPIYGSEGGAWGYTLSALASFVTIGIFFSKGTGLLFARIKSLTS